MDGMANKKGAVQGRRRVVGKRGSSFDGQGNTSETRLYETWLSVLCMGMAIYSGHKIAPKKKKAEKPE